MDSKTVVGKAVDRQEKHLVQSLWRTDGYTVKGVFEEVKGTPAVGESGV